MSVNDNERIPLEIPHLTEFLAEEMETRGWSRDVLATLLLVERFKEDWGKTKLELDLWFEVGPRRKNILFTEKFSGELATVFGVSPELLRNLHARWMSHGLVKLDDEDQP